MDRELLHKYVAESGQVFRSIEMFQDVPLGSAAQGRERRPQAVDGLHLQDKII